MLDFTIDLHTNQIQKVGYYSRSEPREATREEILLWNRLLELENICDERRPQEAKAILNELVAAAQYASTVRLNPHDFTLLRQHAADRIKMVTRPTQNRERILGEFPILREGDPSTIWLRIDRDVPQGEVHLEL